MVPFLNWHRHPPRHEVLFPAADALECPRRGSKTGLVDRHGHRDVDLMRAQAVPRCDRTISSRPVESDRQVRRHPDAPPSANPRPKVPREASSSGDATTRADDIRPPGQSQREAERRDVGCRPAAIPRNQNGRDLHCARRERVGRCAPDGRRDGVPGGPRRLQRMAFMTRLDRMPPRQCLLAPSAATRTASPCRVRLP
ncbi:hypothetical protein H310_07498 [Aphanomyces invadans]|uniref:Uncharacterized protein n=1 Tax=Aphanomyces invadans TaxID=157072 RepID=A0A024U1D9_9STRA|nr:hypothetical protein H310_07498 [Aphanomyces invadans]ETW00069.1 hypothetical protein H310_07498 [Aphanomyces invadans]|eukprot:XP_008871094.1 hypothetical protein H310_07498 [Aphanomyces invadans]